MSRSTISTFKIFEMFPDAEAARIYLESRLWPNGPVCPVCASGERITTRKAGQYRCNACPETFTVRTNTIFERSHIPLHKWIYAMYLMMTARKSVSSLQMAKEIGITQKSAWFMMHRIREAWVKHFLAHGLSNETARGEALAVVRERNYRGVVCHRCGLDEAAWRRAL